MSLSKSISENIQYIKSSILIYHPKSLNINFVTAMTNITATASRYS